ncbi:5'-3' exonuclease [Pseudobacteriovorax antillogorgiicola]|uniref:5'-3' exonuclease n=1 Tax=Pseudobacteriovorax antillogorgiicola TaxID=1513793 RepID=A0A1Y6BUJ5_9BACT|nr:5'-3' exonuclease [Pseudobacteriovorax antillogorgiicola]TCS53078.1 5'-3' exonuclease [Pseudobacteriovorax antillogorgiicola]SMF26148.1 5'-3' exonuclease [Pseudobacteriovorax antillogorgiicola]
MKLHLVDGTFELFKAYFSYPSTITSSGVEVGAVRGFLRSMFSLLKQDGVTHIAAAFDHTIESFRNDLFIGYKTGEGLEAELANQFPLVEDASQALGIVTWPMIEFEADDALASAAYKWKKLKSLEQIVICSPDKDLCQMVEGNRVITWDRIRKTNLDEGAVTEKFGIPPKSIPDYLALVGDSADGIPGVPRWGAKSTAQILQVFGCIENIPFDLEHWPKVRGGKSLLAQLLDHQDEVKLYKTLATLRRDVPIAETFAQLRWQGCDIKALKKLCKRIEDPAFLQSVETWQKQSQK